MTQKMKAITKYSMLALLSLSALASCGNNGGKSSAVTSKTVSSVTHTYTDEQHPWSDPKTEDESIIETITNVDKDFEFSSGSYGDFMIDIMFNRILGEYSSYGCSYSPNTLDKSYRVVSSNTAIFTVTDPNNGAFTINTKKAGDAVLKIYASNDELLLRKIIRVRYKYKAADVLGRALKYDIYKSWKYDGTLRFFVDDEETGTGTFSGLESGYEVMNRTISMTFKSYEQWADSYRFDIELVEKRDESTLTLACALVSLTADQIIFYYQAGEDELRLATMVPSSLTYLNPELF